MTGMSGQPYRMRLEEMIRYISRANKSLFLLDENGEILAVSASVEAFMGYEREELPGRSIRQVGIEQDLQTLYRETAISDADDTFTNEITLLTKDGHLRQTSCNLLRLQSPEGHPVYILRLDILEEGYEHLLKRFAYTFMKDANLGVLLIDKRYRLAAISDMACRILGLNKEQVLNRSLDEVFAHVPSEHHLVRRSILDGGVVRNHAISWTHDQERFELLLDSHVLKDDDDKIIGACVIFKDVTNLRSLEEQVQRSDRLAMVGQIAAGTAHEIRNPLTSIKGFLQVLKGTFVENRMAKEESFTDIMLNEINRINDLVSEFLLLSKRRNVTYRNQEISAVLSEILPIINNEALLYGVSVNYVSEGEVPPIIADRELLKQVFLNLCKNGIEAMPDGGTLTIKERYEPGDRTVSVEIHDTGPGIPNFVIDKIFDPFFTTKEKGTGLGLSVCQRIIHDIGGLIRVSTKGFGTTFTVYIPVP